MLAQKHGKHEWYLRIQIEDKQEYRKALEYMSTLEFEEVSSYFIIYVYHFLFVFPFFLRNGCTFTLHSTLTIFQAEANMKKYGNVLIENVPNESTLFLKTLCTNYKPSNKPLVDQVRNDDVRRYTCILLSNTVYKEKYIKLIIFLRRKLWMVM